MLRKSLWLYRPWYWPVAVAPVVAAALYCGGSLGQVLRVAFVGACLAAYAEALNDIFDVDSDRNGTRKSLWGVPLSGGSGVLVKEVAPQARLFLPLAIAVPVLAALLMALSLGVPAVSFACLGLLLASAYSVPPIRLRNREMLSPFAQGVGYGGITVALGASIGGAPPFPFTAAIVLSFCVAALGLTADLLDIEDDRSAGRHTLVQRVPGSVLVHATTTIGIVIVAVFGYTSRSGALLLPLLAGTVLASRSIACVWSQGRSPLIHAFTVLSETALPFVVLS